MIAWEKDFFQMIRKCMDVLLMAIPIVLAWNYYYRPHGKIQCIESRDALIAAIFCLLYFLSVKLYDGFVLSTRRISDLVFSQMLAAVLADGMLWMMFWVLKNSLPRILPMIVAFLVQSVVATIWSLTAHRWYFRTHPPKNTLMVTDDAKELSDILGDPFFALKFKVMQTVTPGDLMMRNSCLIKGIDTVFLAGGEKREEREILYVCALNRIEVFVLPEVENILVQSAQPRHILNRPFLRIEPYYPGPAYVLTKRLIDIIFSSGAMVALSPIMLLTAAAIKLTDGGDVFYRQVRLTQQGRRFEIIKFRSMRMDAEKDGVARLSSGDEDDRITPVGRVIRKYRIDELPQLLNILKGDMSVVGPRPERPELAAEYEAVLPEFALRLQAKAGLTGYAQVYGKYNSTPRDKLMLDLCYITNPSIREDVKIVFATIKVLFQPESTEGVSKDQVSALRK